MTSGFLFSDIFEPGIFFEREDLLHPYSGIMSPELQSRREETAEFLKRDVWQQVFSLFQNLPGSPEKGYHAEDGVLSSVEEDCTDNIVRELIHSLVPWRKGPWNISGNRIDAEWQSNIKYDGIRDIILSMPKASILDIGSGNGYYGFRALKDGASMVLCLDPSEKFFFQFELFQRYAQEPRIQYELLGYQYTSMLPLRFDIVLCMGILYHQKNPFEVLESARQALVCGGMLILESMTYPSSESISFIPSGRYAKARNVYQVPSAQALVSMCLNSGFTDVVIHNQRTVSLEEQRRTEYAPYESLKDFLDPDDPSRTIEGYPAPERAVVTARKKKIR